MEYFCAMNQVYGKRPREQKTAPGQLMAFTLDTQYKGGIMYGVQFRPCMMDWGGQDALFVDATRRLRRAGLLVSPTDHSLPAAAA